MLSLLRRITKRRPSREARDPLRRLELPGDPAFTYAIGDVHGCLDKLQALEAAIVADAADCDGLKLLVFLGDYVDRGPDSAGVLAHLVQPPPPGFQRVCLRGNHDDFLLRVLRRPEVASHWLELGGRETLLSYGYDLEHLSTIDRRGTMAVVEQFVAEFPAAHRAFLERLPVLLATASYVFVHAGLRPGLPLDAQADNDMLWIRDEFIHHDGPPFSRPVVHGHTPTVRPVLSRYRIGVDTGACMGGSLTAVRLSSEGLRLIAVD